MDSAVAVQRKGRFTLHQAIAFRSGLGPYKGQGGGSRIGRERKGIRKTTMSDAQQPSESEARPNHLYLYFSAQD